MDAVEKISSNRNQKHGIVTALLSIAVFLLLSTARPKDLNSIHFLAFSVIALLISSFFPPLSASRKKYFFNSILAAIFVFVSFSFFFACIFIYKIGEHPGAQSASTSILENVQDFIFLCLSASFFCWAWLSIFIARLGALVIVR